MDVVAEGEDLGGEVDAAEDAGAAEGVSKGSNKKYGGKSSYELRTTGEGEMFSDWKSGAAVLHVGMIHSIRYGGT